jgi:predicted nucleic acid-binding protein
MITAVDSNVLIDVFGGDASFGATSVEALRRCAVTGRLIACDVVFAEVAAAFPGADRAAEALGRLRIEFVALDAEAALHAGHAWRAYRSRGGSRVRVTSDFLIAAHAARHADQLLTRDRGVAKLGFDRLRIADPTA